MVGLGYVGLPFACLASQKGWTVHGIVRSQDKADLINAKHSPFHDPMVDRWLRQTRVRAVTSYDVVRDAEVVVVCVPTPVDELYNPDLGPIRDAINGILPFLRRGHLIIIESTVNPGVCEEIVLPILKSSGLRENVDFHLAHCPERIDPGNARWNVRNIPRVLGATSRAGLEKAMKFYESILDAPVLRMKSIREAEAVKILENSFRDVNIAFVNEIARSFALMGIDTVDVINGARTKPFAFLAHYPSAGVGGHCIPVDPYYLIEKAQQMGFNHGFLKLAREINNSMPAYAVELLVQALNERKKAVKTVRVGLLGLSYKANVADTRESPSYAVLKILRETYGAQIETFDPFVPEESTVKSLRELLAKCDALILMANHKQFNHKLSGAILKRNSILAVVDGKNALDGQSIRQAGIAYRGIGR